jgi:hypothetical protein
MKSDVSVPSVWLPGSIGCEDHCDPATRYISSDSTSLVIDDIVPIPATAPRTLGEQPF